jgi:hypothetical protein
MASFLGTRNGGGAAWLIAASIAGVVFVYPEYSKWAKDRALSEKYALGTELMRRGETSERYKKFVQENSETKKKSEAGWFKR